MFISLKIQVYFSWDTPLQTMARIHAEILHDFDCVVQCHQDVVTLLVIFDSEHDANRDDIADINDNARLTSPT